MLHRLWFKTLKDCKYLCLDHHPLICSCSLLVIQSGFTFHCILLFCYRSVHYDSEQWSFDAQRLCFFSWALYFHVCTEIERPIRDYLLSVCHWPSDTEHFNSALCSQTQRLSCLKSYNLEIHSFFVLAASLCSSEAGICYHGNGNRNVVSTHLSEAAGLCCLLNTAGTPVYFESPSGIWAFPDERHKQQRRGSRDP